MEKSLKSIEVCFSPANLKYYNNISEKNIVVIDILRATTAICNAFNNGVKEMIPIAKIEDISIFKQNGYIIAGERDGQKLENADIGNSPFNFTPEIVKDKTIVISTTNGTQAIEYAKESKNIIIGSFINITAVSDWLIKQDENIILLCAGWKNKFNLEDTIYAGAVIEQLMNREKYQINCDSAMASLDLWSIAKENLLQYIEKASHRNRLKKMNLDDIIEFCFTKDICDIVPILKGNKIISATKI